MIFSYDWEGRLGAVLAAECGSGRAVAISPHPEMTQNDQGTAVLLDEPLLPAAAILRQALLWSAGRDA